MHYFDSKSKSNISDLDILSDPPTSYCIIRLFECIRLDYADGHIAFIDFDSKDTSYTEQSWNSCLFALQASGAKMINS